MQLAVAVTGPTGTFGEGLIPLLEADPRVARIVGVARRPFDPSARGWRKMEYRQGDVRDQPLLEQAFAGVDVVVHLAFLIMGTAPPDLTREVNVEGTVRAFRAAAAVGAKRFVYASSIAAYGFHPDNPIGMDEEWPVRPARHFFYAQEKAEIEELLGEESRRHPDLDLYVLRPVIVLGPHAVGAKELLPPALAPLGRAVGSVVERVPIPLPVPVPVVVPDLPVQFVHEEDVGQAFVLCIVGAGPPGAYNIAGDGVLTAADVAKELGFAPVRVPATVVRPVAGVAASLPRLPGVPTLLEWAETLTHPAIIDTTKAKRDLGWQPRYTTLEALRATIEAWR